MKRDASQFGTPAIRHEGLRAVQREMLAPHVLAKTAGFTMLEGVLARDVRNALRSTVKEGVVFCDGSTPLTIFRHAVAAAIGRIHEDGRAPVFLRFLKDGPYFDGGKIPRKRQREFLTDDETTSMITFIYSHMVNCFKGALTEMLAVTPCLRILRELQAEKRLPREARLYVGDTVWAVQRKGDSFAKAADLHILVVQRSRAHLSVTVAGVAEVKSYFQSPERLRRQLDQHLTRARRGLRVGKIVYSPDQITVGGQGGSRAVRITVLPAHWTLPRTFYFEQRDGRKCLHVDPGVPRNATDSVERPGPLEWRVALRWSKETLDAAAYGMTFWFMEKVGEVLYSNGVPKGWEEMSPAEAGQNAAKMMLYYALLRCRTRNENNRAVALYNSYSFGCALGMNFRDTKGQRVMLWPQDLDEILTTGQNKGGSRII